MSDRDEHFEEGEETAPPGTGVMEIVRWTIVALMAIAGIVSVLSYVGVFDRSSGSDTGTQYYCPMHPQIVQDYPGECPICSMTLVPREKTPASQPSSQPSVPGLGAITLSPERVQLIGMRTATVARHALDDALRTVGYVAADEERLAQITARFSGYVEELFVAKTGEPVKKGQALASLYSPEVLTAQHELLSAIEWNASRGTESLSKGMLEDARRRLSLLGISPEEIAELERAGKVTRAIVLRSPVSGFVTKKNVVLGAQVQAGSMVFEVADLSSIWVLADVYEHDLSRVRAGQRASVEVAADRSTSIEGRVAYIYPTVDAQSRTARARIELANRDLALRPGMYVSVTIETSAKQALVIPREALIDTGALQYVFVVIEGGRFEPRRVKSGARGKGVVEIVEGLSEGERVVSTSSFVIDSESRLTAAISSTTARPGR